MCFTVSLTSFHPEQNYSENDTFDSSLTFPLPLTGEIIRNS